MSCSGKRADNDHEGMLRLWDENCVIREAPDLPFGGDWSGRDGLTALETIEVGQICPRSPRGWPERRRGLKSDLEGYPWSRDTRTGQSREYATHGMTKTTLRGVVG
jgi:hypothetical protein